MVHKIQNLIILVEEQTLFAVSSLCSSVHIAMVYMTITHLQFWFKLSFILLWYHWVAVKMQRQLPSDPGI